MKTLITSCGLALALACSPQVFAAPVDKAMPKDLVSGVITLKDGKKLHVYTTRDNMKKFKGSHGTLDYVSSWGDQYPDGQEAAGATVD